jgi:phospholipid/cholesterol/gamma-HCH transport system substrate-binding protein
VKISKEIKAGFIAILSLGLLYWGINFLKGKDVFSDQKLAYAVYDRIDGLTAAHPVTINGFQVGQVNRIYFHPDRDGRLMVEMSFTSDFQIPINSIARINTASLLGNKVVELELGNSSTYLAAGDTLPSEITRSLTEEVNRQVLPLKQKAENLIGSIDTAMTLLTGFLNERTRSNFMATFESVRKSFETLEHTSSELDLLVSDNRSGITSIVENVKEISDALGENAEELSQVINHSEAIADTLSQAKIGKTMRSLNHALQQADTILTNINSGKGTMGMLINDPELYRRLESASEELNMLLLDIQYNPNRYIHFSVFGSSKEYDSEQLQKLADEKESKRKSNSVNSNQTEETNPSK